MKYTEQQTAVMLRVSGYVYRNGHRTVSEFEGFFGISLAQLPRETYHVTGTGLVVLNSKFANYVNAIFAEHRYYMDMLAGRF